MMIEILLTVSLAFLLVGYWFFEAAILERVWKLLNTLPAVKFVFSATYRREKLNEWKQLKTSYAVYEMVGMGISLLVLGAVLITLINWAA